MHCVAIAGARFQPAGCAVMIPIAGIDLNQVGKPFWRVVRRLDRVVYEAKRYRA